jgi:hypothetical protein
MSTNSSISVKTKDGIKTIYCHWDGDINYNGRMLYSFYNTQEKIESLIELGDISFLDKSSIKPEGHSFNEPVKGYTVSYGRDSNYSDTDYRCYDSIKEMLKNEKREYNYYFENDTWYLIDETIKKEVKTLLKGN